MPDYNFIAQPQVPDSFRKVGEIINMMRGATELQKSRATLQADIEQRKAESSRATTEAGVATQTAPARVTQQQQATQLAITEAAKAAQSLTQDQRGIVAGVIGTLGRAGISDPAAYKRELLNLKTVNPNNQGLHTIVDSYQTVLDNLPKGSDLPKMAVGASQFLLTPQQQQSVMTPQAGLQPMGGTINQVISTPSVMGSQPSASISPAGVPTTLPPTTQRYNPDTKQMEFVGQAAEPVGTVGSEAEARAIFSQNPSRPMNVELKPPVAAAPPLGAERGILGSVEAVNKDWLDTQDSAKTAQTDIGVLQNVKKYAPGAVTGVESDRRAYLTGLAGLLGMTTAQLAKTETDVLAKNTVMLALAGGDTNLAKTMAESANPNTKMTPAAIKLAADQIIAQRQLAIEKQKFLGPFKSLNDPDLYSRALTKWNEIADPRILQLPNMSKEEKEKMKHAMSETEAKDFGAKIRALQELGIVK